jgi:hypothetical protein
MSTRIYTVPAIHRLPIATSLTGTSYALRLHSAAIEIMTRKAAALGATQTSLANTSVNNSEFIVCLSFFDGNWFAANACEL